MGNEDSSLDHPIAEDIYTFAGHTLDLACPRAVQTLLFDELQLPETAGRAVDDGALR